MDIHFPSLMSKLSACMSFIDFNHFRSFLCCGSFSSLISSCIPLSTAQPSANQPFCLAECPVQQVHPRLTQQ
ncbi:hypothetical protein SCLCIDRAFT_290606 [Scleroderma citrinum Foug A]|uniref:Uncharacterized protein n=1 Tax=Scleroderma citrinum Foug A TaxID=1036808 RepID=A0A0C3DH22_9AGAM|nr:hypothetical protein SCLCIDRAFT_290606 [Scleroderma citrinum Foug A]